MVSPHHEKIQRLQGLSAFLRSRIKGQDEAQDCIASALVRGELGLAQPHRPKGSFLFVGPTGVGKTETTLAFSDYLFGARPLRFDMSEYQLQSSVDKLIGGPPSERGLLGGALARQSHGTLLFDEIEKAHPLVLDLFLQILEDARITLATGETVNLSQFYIVCTSNIGTAETMRMESVPFATVERTVLMRVREQMRPELPPRFNEIVVFARLDYVTQRTICETMIIREVQRLKLIGHEIEITPQVIECLVRKGYHRTLGARPMRSMVERTIQDAIADDLLNGRSGSGRLVVDEPRNRIELV